MLKQSGALVLGAAIASTTMLAILATPTVAFAWGGTEGCTPGFWKNHPEDWAETGLSPNDSVEETFGIEIGNDKTLMQALKTGGGGANALLRHAVAALLNSLTYPDVDYKYEPDEVIEKVQDAFSGERSFQSVKNQLELQNEKGCPL
jgi:hypothetical protein